MIRLSVPGTLEYRDVAMRVVSAAAKLVLPGRRGTQFDAQVVSAFGEAFNNIAIHGYGRDAASAGGEVELVIDVQDDTLLMRISDHGRSFDPLVVPDPELDELPERGMGLFIIRSFVDTVTYTPGRPNVLELAKRCTVYADSSPPVGPPPRVSVPPASPPRPPAARGNGNRNDNGNDETEAKSEGQLEAREPENPAGKASKSRRAGASRVRPVQRRDHPADPSLPLGSRRK